MDVSVIDQLDRLSDYGSDFTADEEEIIYGLLNRAPHETKVPNADQPLQLRDIEDDETPRGAKVLRRLGHERWSYGVPAVQSLEVEKLRVTIQIDGGSILSTNGTLNDQAKTAVLTDIEAHS